jgi:hypothetical protein
MSTDTYTGPTCLEALEAEAVRAMLAGDLSAHYRWTRLAAKLEAEYGRREDTPSGGSR